MNDLIKIKMIDSNRELWPAFLHDALLLKNKFDIEIVGDQKLCEQCDYLHFFDGVLHFHGALFGNMHFDFKEIFTYHQRQNYAISREPLAKALGIKGEYKPVVWDTTCGTGKDSLLIHYFGAILTSFERHPAIYLLLADAKRRYPLDFPILFADASQASNNHSPIIEKPDVIYYDPMYPDKMGSKKSALPRKEMRIFKELVGEDLDSIKFLEWALKNAKERVVIKRSINAPPIKNNPTASYTGKSTRYDMYKVF